MSTRSIKPVAKTTKTSAAVPHVEEVVHGQTKAEQDDLFERFKKAGDDYMASFGVTWDRRRIVGLVLGLIASCGVGYLIGHFVSLVAVAVLIASSSLFLTLLVYIVGVIVAAIVGGRVGGAVFTYIGDGTAQRHLSSAKNWVTGLFGSKKPLTA